MKAWEIAGPRLSNVSDTFGMAQSRPETTSARPSTREAVTDHVHFNAPSRYISVLAPCGLPITTTALESIGRSQSEAPLHVEISYILR